MRLVKTQISLWSESSLSAWRNLGSLTTHWVYSKDSDQTGLLIWVFAGCTGHFVVLSCSGSNSKDLDQHAHPCCQTWFWGVEALVFRLPMERLMKTDQTVWMCRLSWVWWTHKWAATWQNQQSVCVPIEDLDQPGHPPSLIRVFAVHLMGS